MKPDGDENQNTPNTAPNADPTQQAVFTPNTPQPSAPAQNQQVITGSVVEPTSTGLSHQYYSNHPTKTSASGIGDIVVANNSRAKTKKPLIIGAIIIGVLVILTLIIVLISSVSNSTSQLSKIEQSFNQFANYMLYGNDSASSLTEVYQYGSQYYISHLSNDDEKKDFLTLAQEKFQHFHDEYNKYLGTSTSEDSEDANDEGEAETADDLLAILNAYSEDLNMALYTQSSPILSANEIMLYYIEDADTVASEIRKYYEAPNSASNEVLAHAEQNIQDANTLLSAYGAFSQYGCIAESGNIDNLCILSNSANLSDANQVVESYNTMFSAVSAESYNRSVRLYQNIWVIQEKLNEKN